jgi:ABC-type transporter Mla subunit MlaD
MAIAFLALTVMAVTVTIAAIKVIDRAPEVDQTLNDAQRATRTFNDSADDIAPTLRELRRVTRDLGGG